MKAESAILREVLLALGSRPDVRLWRFAAGNGWVRTSLAYVPMQFVPIGFPDLAGWVSICGFAIFLGVECKAVIGQLTAEQQHWRDWILNAGGCHLVARSADQASLELDVWIGSAHQRLSLAR